MIRSHRKITSIEDEMETHWVLKLQQQFEGLRNEYWLALWSPLPVGINCWVSRLIFHHFKWNVWNITFYINIKMNLYKAGEVFLRQSVVDNTGQLNVPHPLRVHNPLFWKRSTRLHMVMYDSAVVHSIPIEKALSLWIVYSWSKECAVHASPTKPGNIAEATS